MYVCATQIIRILYHVEYASFACGCTRPGNSLLPRPHSQPFELLGMNLGMRLARQPNGSAYCINHIIGVAELTLGWLPLGLGLAIEVPNLHNTKLLCFHNVYRRIFPACFTPLLSLPASPSSRLPTSTSPTVVPHSALTPGRCSPSLTSPRGAPNHAASPSGSPLTSTPSRRGYTCSRPSLAMATSRSGLVLSLAMSSLGNVHFVPTPFSMVKKWNQGCVLESKCLGKMSCTELP